MEKKIKILFLIDWHKDNEWAFWNYFPTDKIDYDVLGLRFPKGTKSSLAKVVFIWTRYLIVGLMAFIKKNKYDIVIAWQQVEGIVFGFLKYIFNCQRPKLIITQLLFVARENRLNNLLRVGLLRKALASVDLIGCSSSAVINMYVEIFKIDPNKFRFVPSITGVIDNPRFYQGIVGNYILSAGRSCRDYKTLIDAFKPIDDELIIITQPNNVKGLDLPSNVRVIHNVHGSEFISILEKAKFVVLSLDNTDVTAGLMVLWQSMSLGKAVIISKIGGIIDYVKDDVEVKFVKPFDAENLRETILDLLSHPDKIEKLGMNAIQTIRTKYTWKPFCNEVANLILDVHQN